ncbi:MAG: type II toxin-antitoxin system VapB family antitoxin [Deltaproteobacteria bacterium]|nr:type II toxin-antitoxin system VapB family antitoxin [Deltaproteobacteria bacterium]
MRATFSIPDNLLNEVQAMANEKSKTKAVVIAMREFVKAKKAERLLALKGMVAIDYDWEKEEALELKKQIQREKRHGA